MNNNIDPLPYAKLLLNQQAIPLDDCWLEGYEASEHGTEELSNPYPVNSKAFNYWQAGWWAAFYGEAPLFELVEKQEVIQENPVIHFMKKYWRTIQMSMGIVAAIIFLQMAEFIFNYFASFELSLLS